MAISDLFKTKLQEKDERLQHKDLLLQLNDKRLERLERTLEEKRDQVTELKHRFEKPSSQKMGKCNY